MAAAGTSGIVRQHGGMDMTITFGRRRLILALEGAPRRRKPIDLPMAESATDAELARINALNASLADRTRWEVTSILYGGPLPR